LVKEIKRYEVIEAIKIGKKFVDAVEKLVSEK